VYQALLTRKYLTTKIMPVLAMLAVTLSVATVLVTWSVMGGFLRTLLDSGRTLIGDVAVTWPNTGFAYYDDLIERLEGDDLVEAAAPIIETYGLVSLPDDQVKFAQIKGVQAGSFDDVTDYAQTVWWRPKETPARKDVEGIDPRLQKDEGYYTAEGEFAAWNWSRLKRDGLTLSEPDGTAAAVPGIHVSGWNRRTSGGIYVPNLPQRARADGTVAAVREFLPHSRITLHVLPLDSTGRPRVDVVTRTVPVANEFFSGMFEIDSRTVLARLDLLQSMLDMDAAERVASEPGGAATVDPATGELVFEQREVIERDPARVTSVIVKGAAAKERQALAALERRVEDIYAGFADDHAGEVPSIDRIRIRTWRQLNATTIAAVEKETGLVLFVFGLVCFTTVFLVLAIFWSMVSEKTKDIGILRSLGAGTAGITWLWLRYGTAIGVVGSALGIGAAWLVIRNINDIHTWLGETFGVVIWDPSVYYFVEIPTDMDWTKTAVVAVAGVGTCLLGAAVPALRAGLMDPVQSLRFE